jgi:predicted nucleic acid-binding protein
MSFFVLDASVWVARLVPQDEFHETVKAWMAEQRTAEVQFISPSLLLTEVAGAVSRRTGSAALGRKALRELETLPGLRLVEMNNTLLFEGNTGSRSWIARRRLGLCGSGKKAGCAARHV